MKTPFQFCTVLALVASPFLTAAPEDVSADLSRFTEDGMIPGMTVVAIRDGQIIATGASGVRKHGDEAKVTIHDKFHIGSCTKSMTGTLAAMLVQDGKIKWDTTVAEVFPDIEIHQEYKKTTLQQLVSNSGGVPGDIPPALWAKTVADRENPEGRQRHALIRALLAEPPSYQPGGKRVYSNGGFTVAGGMLEKVTGKSYNVLLRDRLFKPLGMTSAGFGMPAHQGKTDQPWGHIITDGKILPVPPGPDSDNPPAITPAGRVHLSILDFAKYANFHLGQSPGSLLDEKSLTFIHTAAPPDKDYAAGWVTLDRPWGDGPVLMHNGTNTMNYAVIWLAPKKNFGVIALCNSGSPTASKVCDDAVAMLIERFLK